MSKLMGYLQKQLQTEFKKDAEGCIKIYEKLKELSDNSLWSLDWRQLITIGGWMGDDMAYKPTKLGYELLKGIEKDIQKMNIYVVKEICYYGMVKIIAAKNEKEAVNLSDFKGEYDCKLICSTSDYKEPSILHTIY